MNGLGSLHSSNSSSGGDERSKATRVVEGARGVSRDAAADAVPPEGAGAPDDGGAGPSSLLPTAAGRATSFVVEGVASGLPASVGGGYANANAGLIAEEAVFPFPSEYEDEEDAEDEDEEETARGEEAGTEDADAGEGEDDADRAVEAVLTAKTPPAMSKKKSFLKRAFKKKSKANGKKQQDVDHVVVDQDDAEVGEGEENVAVPDEGAEAAEDEEDTTNGDEAPGAVVPEADGGAVREGGEIVGENNAGGDREDDKDDDFGTDGNNADPNATHKGFLKRAMFNKTKRSTAKKQTRGSEGIVPDEERKVTGDQGEVAEESIVPTADGRFVEDQDEVESSAIHPDDAARAADDPQATKGGSFFKRAFKMSKLSLATKKKKRPELQGEIAPAVDDAPPVSSHDDDEAVGGEDDVDGEGAVDPEVDAVTEARYGTDDGAGDRDEDDPPLRFFALDISPNGDVEAHTPSKGYIPFNWVESPIAL